MARSEKFKRSDLVPVLKEGFRQLKEYRNNVDETRTEQNYTYGCQTWKEAISKAKERESEIMDGKINKQSKPLFSWVVPYPKGRTSVSEHDFFEAVRDYMDIHYGVDNVIAVCVHMDETTPHCHCYIVPETISRKNGKRTVSVGSLLDRKGLLEFHKKCNEYMFERFKEPNMIKLPEEEKAKENVSMMELKRRTLKAENETLTAGNKELETQRMELTNSVSTLKNELRMIEEKRKQELERSQASIDAQISAYKDKRVKELNEELRPLKLRKKRIEDDIKQMTTENWDKYQAFEEYQYWSDLANKAKQAFESFRNWMSEWQLGKVKKEQETYQAKHNPKQKNDDWDMEM